MIMKLKDSKRKKTPEEAILKMIFLLIHFPLLCGPQVDLWVFM